MALEPIRLGSVTLDPVLVLLALACLAVLALIALAVTLIVHMRGRRRETQAQGDRACRAQGTLADLRRDQRRPPGRRRPRRQRAARPHDPPRRLRPQRDLAQDARVDRQAERAAGRHRHRAEEPDRPLHQHGLACRRSSPTSRRAAPSARCAWRASSRTGCPRAPTRSSRRSRTASGPTACCTCRTQAPAW